jgi:S1-C subfamily serine protease
MNERVIIRRLSGGKTTETEEFPMAENPELLIGREVDCKIKFDASKDDLVSRRHAKIVIDKMDPVEATITDLGSSNGTFLNRQRVFTSMKLNPGDLIQLGPGGPEFSYDYEPKSAKATRMADVPPRSVLAAPTREAAVSTATAKAAPVPPPLAPPPVSASGSTTVGKATVERMITQTRSQTRNQMLAVGFVLLLIVAGGGAYLLTRPASVKVVERVHDGPTSNKVDGSVIAQKNTPAVVYIEVAWNLIDSNNSTGLSQVYFPNAVKGPGGKMVKIDDESGPTLPVFVLLKGDPEPVLSTDSGGGDYVPIGERGTGSGFVVNDAGFILTNRHVAAGWETSYSGWREHRDNAGILLTPNDKGGFNESILPASQFPARWVPAQAKVIVEGRLGQANMHLVRDSLGFAAQVQGRNDVLNVVFAKSSDRTRAELVKFSDHADVAEIKVSAPNPLPTVTLNDNYDTVQPGSDVTVMGYPGVSPQLLQARNSVDIFNGSASLATIASPTTTRGNIGQVLRNGSNNTDDHVVMSSYGDYYQLAINTTGAGNSGGPVFDDQGKVIGIFTASRTAANASVTFALPIRYGMELIK